MVLIKVVRPEVKLKPGIRDSESYVKFWLVVTFIAITTYSDWVAVNGQSGRVSTVKLLWELLLDQK